MKNQSFSNRIALHFMLAVAVLMLMMFSAVYFVVFRTVYNHIDSDLNAESLEVNNSIVMLSDELVFSNPGEWFENEHGQIEVNPTFIQIADSAGQILKKTPNLQGSNLIIHRKEHDKEFFNSTLSGSKVRQLQVTLRNFRGNHFGYLSIAVPLEDAQLVLVNLRTVLLFLIPVAFIFLFFATRFIAQNSIRPVLTLTHTTEKITRKNLNERIPMPAHKDELYILTESINNLLARIQDALLRERQFTSDASHELRTPLSVIKGNLEIMSRKERESSYYLEKSKQIIKEVDRMSLIIEKLLLLARYDMATGQINMEKINLTNLMQEFILRFDQALNEKALIVDLKVKDQIIVNCDRFMLEQIVENIFSNAIKYSRKAGHIVLKAGYNTDRKLELSISDQGPGIPQDRLNTIFERFFRTDESRSPETGGSGLGLAIVKRFSEIMDISISVQSEEGKYTVFNLIFPASLTLPVELT